MNKNELVKAVAEATDASNAEVARIIDATFSAITTSLKAGEAVRLVNFGTFDTAKRAATTAINPRTKEKINVAERTVAKFRPGKQLKEAVNN